MKIRRLFLPLAAFLLLPAAAWAYRPFVSTDAAVADVKELEIEIGYFNLERNKGNSTFIIPQAVLNYGVIHNLELVAEFAVEEPRHSSTRLVDFALSLKAVLKEGILQEKDGVSFAVEAGALLPSTNKEEKRFGFQGIGILSGRLAPLTAHVNFGGGVDRAHHNPFVVWGVIAELPVAPTFRLVGEINGESVSGHAGASSGLLGVIWKTSLRNLSFDAGVRRGISGAAPPWAFTAGLTCAVSFAPAEGQ